MSDATQQPSKERVAAIRARHTSANGGSCLRPGGYKSSCEVCELLAFMDDTSAHEPPADLQKRAELADRFHDVCQLAVTHLGKFCPNDFRSARKGEFVAAVYAAAESALNGSGEIPPLLRAAQPPDPALDALEAIPHLEPVDVDVLRRISEEYLQMLADDDKEDWFVSSRGAAEHTLERFFDWLDEAVAAQCSTATKESAP